MAGFARGFGFALRIGVLSRSPSASRTCSRTRATTRIGSPRSGRLVLLLVALIAGYARRISGEADRQHTLALDRLGRLADANALLYCLHRVTQTLPASLDLDEVLDTTMDRLRDLFDFDCGRRARASTRPTATWELAAPARRQPVPQRQAFDDLPAAPPAGRRRRGRPLRAQPARPRAVRASALGRVRASTPCCPPAGR